MGEQADTLYERSKSDDKLTGWPSVVGSEIRAAISELRSEIDNLREDLNSQCNLSAMAIARIEEDRVELRRLLELWYEQGLEPPWTINIELLREETRKALTLCQYPGCKLNSVAIIRGKFYCAKHKDIV